MDYGRKFEMIGERKKLAKHIAPLGSLHMRTTD